jgi:hypothetical protein
VKKNAIGILGIVLAIVVALLIVSTKRDSSLQVMVQLDGAIIVLMLGLVSAVRGSLLWLILSGIGLVETAYVVFAIVGH